MATAPGCGLGGGRADGESLAQPLPTYPATWGGTLARGTRLRWPQATMKHAVGVRSLAWSYIRSRERKPPWGHKRIRSSRTCRFTPFGDIPTYRLAARLRQRREHDLPKTGSITHASASTPKALLIVARGKCS